MRGRLVFALILGASGTAQAQRGSQATISIRLYGGTSTSEPMIWSIPRQPILVPGTEASPIYDTVSLTRSITPGLTVGASVLYFPTSLAGLQIGISYQELGLTTACSGVSFFPLGMRHDNEVLCGNIQGSSQPLHVFELGVGGMLRLAPRHAVSPFAMVAGGLADITASTVYLDGADSNGIRVIISDPNPRATAWIIRFGGGFTISLGPGYQFFFSGSDVHVLLARPTGPADRVTHAPIAPRFVANGVFTFGLDVVLGGRRGRRY